MKKWRSSLHSDLNYDKCQEYHLGLQNELIVPEAMWAFLNFLGKISTQKSAHDMDSTGQTWMRMDEIEADCVL